MRKRFNSVTIPKDDNPATEFQGKLSPEEVEEMFRQMKEAPAQSAMVQAPQAEEDSLKS